jgi:hypothetical protein
MKIFFVQQDVSRRQRRLKNLGALAPGFTGAWERQPPTSCAGYIPGHCLPITSSFRILSPVLTIGCGIRSINVPVAQKKYFAYTL